MQTRAVETLDLINKSSLMDKGGSTYFVIYGISTELKGINAHKIRKRWTERVSTCKMGMKFIPCGSVVCLKAALVSATEVNDLPENLTHSSALTQPLPRRQQPL